MAKIMNVNFKTQVIFCKPKTQFSMSTLRPKSICVDIKHNCCVDVLNFNLNNCTQQLCLTRLIKMGGNTSMILDFALQYLHMS